MTNFQARRALLNTSALVGAIALSFGAAGAALAQTRNYDIPPEPLSKALRDYGQASGRQIIFTEDLVRGHNAPPLHGPFSADDALARLLYGTGLRSEFSPSGAIMIMRSPSPQVQGAPAEPASTVGEVVVTGSHIKGASLSAPVITMTQAQIIDAGQTDLGQAMRAMPADFGGGQNPSVGTGIPGIANQNITGASTFNLRGLGQDATLTLFNGHRLSYDGFSQGIDATQIPLAAVSQVQVLLDGASAIYGSDAVAGVVNIMIKPDFDGVTTTAQFGAATDGGDVQQQYSLVAGKRWNSGGFMIAYNYIKQDPIYDSERNYTTYSPNPNTLLPGEIQNSVILSAHQDLSPSIHMSVDALYNGRNTNDYYVAFYPYDLSKNIDFSSEFAVSPTIAIDLPGSWTASLNGVYSQDNLKYNQLIYAPSGPLEARYSGCYCNSMQSIELDGGGPLFRLPAGAVKTAIGVGYRNSSLNVTYSGPVPSTHQSSSDYAFGEIDVPLVSPDQGVPGVRRLALNGAFRYENYTTFGGVTTPKLGVVWSPTEDFDLKASWGKSYKVPTLLQEYQEHYAVLEPASDIGGPPTPASATALVNLGGNPSLRPEQATTITAGAVFHPMFTPGLRVEINYYHIDYIDRVVQPVTNLGAALSGNANYAPFINGDPTAAQTVSLVNAVGSNFENFVPGPFLASNVAAIVNDVYLNAESQVYDGVDLSGDYTTDFAGGTLTSTASTSWLEGRQQTGAGTAFSQTVGTVYNPPHWRARGGLVWKYGGFTGATFVNFIGAETDNRTARYTVVDSQTTLDLSLGYKIDSGPYLLKNTELRLSVTNIFDAVPPYLAPSSINAAPYDPTNYSPIGRLVSLSISKHW